MKSPTEYSNFDIPVIDICDALSSQSDPAKVKKIVELFKHSATHSGFFYVRHHGVPQALIERQFSLAKELFDLPLDVKQHLDGDKNPSHLGFELFGAQQSDRSARPDQKEGFYCTKTLPSDHPYVVANYQCYGINQWPREHLPAMEAHCQEYIGALEGLAHRLMQLIAMAFGFTEGYFADSLIDSMITLKMIRYPPHPEDACSKTFGVGTHTDWGSITILAQDNCGGLEVCLPGGEWVAAPPIPNTFIVNFGDLMPRWSNGLFKSNPHRVRNNLAKGATRYSIPFFFGPSYPTPINALPGCVKEGETYQYTPTTAGAHMVEMYHKVYEASSSKA